MRRTYENYYKKYYEANKDEILARTRVYRRKYSRKYYRKNKLKILEQRRLNKERKAKEGAESMLQPITEQKIT